MARQTLVVLTLNEIAGVRAVMPEVVRRFSGLEILAVDGGSSDGTAEVLGEELGIRVCGQERPGRGEAFRVAMRESEGDHVVFFSPDGNEDPDDITRLFEALERGADMAIASRFLPGARNEEDEEWLAARKWANRAFTLAANLAWNRGRPRVTDTINGFRGLTRVAFGFLAPRSLRFTIEYEMTIGAMRAAMTVIEIATSENQRIGGETKGPSMSVGLDFLRFFLAQLVRHGLGSQPAERAAWAEYRARCQHQGEQRAH